MNGSAHAGRGTPIRGASCTYKLEARALPAPSQGPLGAASSPGGNRSLHGAASRSARSRAGTLGVMRSPVDTLTNDPTIVEVLSYEDARPNSVVIAQGHRSTGERRRDTPCRNDPQRESTPVAVRPRITLFDDKLAAPPPDRGRLWYDFEIPDEFFRGLPGIEQKVRWVREHLPKDTRIRIGQKSAWYESDIRAFLESRRAAV